MTNYNSIDKIKELCDKIGCCFSIDYQEFEGSWHFMVISNAEVENYGVKGGFDLCLELTIKHLERFV